MLEIFFICCRQQPEEDDGKVTHKQMNGVQLQWTFSSKVPKKPKLIWAQLEALEEEKVLVELEIQWKIHKTCLGWGCSSCFHFVLLEKRYSSLAGNWVHVCCYDGCKVCSLCTRGWFMDQCSLVVLCCLSATGGGHLTGFKVCTDGHTCYCKYEHAETSICKHIYRHHSVKCTPRHTDACTQT